eukprot:4491253-Pyramimonas_sp.AAC.1
MTCRTAVTPTATAETSSSWHVPVHSVGGVWTSDIPAVWLNSSPHATHHGRQRVPRLWLVAA